jgi:high affinity Mn2+ porin
VKTAASLLLAAAWAIPAAAQTPPPAERWWDWGFQATTITQTAPSFDAPYEGPHSFLNEGSQSAHTTFLTTLPLAAHLWPGAWASIQPEFSGGSGVGGGQGIAAFPNQDVLRVPSLGAKPYFARVFVQQSFPLGAPEGELAAPGKPEEKFSPGGAHLYAVRGPRLEVTLGKMSLADVFDGSEASDAHHGLMSWGHVNNGAWDFAADTRGYTWGLTVAYEGSSVAARAGAYAMPEIANGPTYDHEFSKAHGLNAEVEWDFDAEQAGALRVLGYVNRARMGDYAASLALAGPGGVPDITATREEGRSKYGFGLNAQRRVGGFVLFGRLGWNDGKTESFAYTEIDRTVSLGASHTGAPWGREADIVRLAVVVSGLSDAHRRYLEAGGLGFQIGDGRLSYGPEWLAELDYDARLTAGVSVGLDAQLVANPGYNRDRGPITVLGLRVHVHR